MHKKISCDSLYHHYCKNINFLFLFVQFLLDLVMGLFEQVIHSTWEKLLGYSI